MDKVLRTDYGERKSKKIDVTEISTQAMNRDL